MVPGWWIWLARKDRELRLRISGRIGVAAARLPRRKLKAYALVVIGLMFAANVAVLWQSLHGHASGFSAGHIRVPAHVREPPGGRRGPPVGQRLPLAGLDSVLKDSAGKRAFDSLLRVRPGLADTVRLLRGLDATGP